MSDQAPLQRLIICVDGAEYDSNGTLGYVNHSTVSRLKAAIATSNCVDDKGRSINQTVRYYQAPGDGQNFVHKIYNKQSVYSTEQQIKDIVKDVCQILDPSGELFLFGFSRGGFIVRAVAGILHHMGIPKQMQKFNDIYQKVHELEKARKIDDSYHGPKILKALRSCTDPGPTIQLIGVFDCSKGPEKSVHDITFVSSARHLRHALAFNEARFAQDLCPLPDLEDMKERTFIQAWFIGSNQDIGGGSQHDGLSLYPLQWMILESMRLGLVFRRDLKPGETMSLAFPQFTGELPRIDSEEKVEWRTQYRNGIQVTMYDLASLHSETATIATHSIRINQAGNIKSGQRKVFSEGLIDWTDRNYGTILHPSLFCVLERYPRFYEQSQIRMQKRDLADFQERCLAENANAWPWLEGMHLSASGVKAFRILVCGKTGVGKSTLINKIFGVEMTEESTSYSQGVHDINKAFESPNHPGLLIHDSRGWQAGSDQELELIAKFLRHRAFQKDPANALHVIWFCVDSDVSRIEEADKRTFETIAQFSHHVPVFVVGTKKDKLVAYHKVQLLEEYMSKSNDFVEASKLATAEADRLANEQFLTLRKQLAQIKHYKADGYSCVSKDDDAGVKQLLSNTLELITDDRVRLFCVAAQVVDVEQKIDSAVTECMRLSAHAIRTAMVPLPLSSMIGTPTVSRILCEHILQCFGFPKAAPEAVTDIMQKIVLKNLRSFMMVSITQFLAVGATTVGVALVTAGIGTVLGLASSIISSPPTARMLFKCACDMILILERSFRYGGKYVSVKQIEDAAVYYTIATTKSFNGKTKLLQQHVHDEIDALIPLKKVMIALKFSGLRSGLEEVIYKNRFEKGPDRDFAEIGGRQILEMEGEGETKPTEEGDPLSRSAFSRAPVGVSELPGDSGFVELESPINSNIHRSGTVMTTTSTIISTGTTSSVTSDSTLTDTLFKTETEDSSVSELSKTRTGSGSTKLPGYGWTRRMSSRLGLKKTKSEN